MATPLEKFRQQVKIYRRAHPGVSFRSAQKTVKRQGGKAAVGRIRHKSKPKKKKVGSLKTSSKTHTDKNRFKNVDIQIGSISHHMRLAKKGLNQKMDKLVVKRHRAKKSAQKKKISKEMAKINRQLAKLP